MQITASFPQKVEHFFHDISSNKAYYAFKAAACVLGGAGAVCTLGGAVWAWPKVATWIATGTSHDAFILAKVTTNFIAAWIDIMAACAQAGDVGGLCALFVGLIGGVILLTPLLLAFGVPLLPGAALVVASVFLWNQAEQYRAEQ
jgi:hypothetical protein